MKKITSIFLVIVMLLTFAPINILAGNESNSITTDSKIDLQSSDDVMESIFGSEIGKGVETDEGYMYEMTPEVVDSFIDPIKKVADKEGIKIGPEEYAGNVLPEDYVDNSNVELLKIQEEIKNESTVNLMSTDEESVAKVDVIFVVDSTGSMYSAISGVKSNVATFARYLNSKGLTLRLGLIDYRDITCDGANSTVVHKISSSPWMNVDGFLTKLSGVRVDGGGDWEETPIDALGHLTNGKTINWSSDAYKFAILITDASYKNNNTHGISNMSAMTKLLSDRDIHTSVITSSYCYSDYGELAMMTGGFTANISENFASLLADYADSIIGTTMPVSEYSVQVLDAVTTKPISNATVSWSGSSVSTNSTGMATITTNENPVTDVMVTHSLYGIKNVGSLSLKEDETTKIYISSTSVGSEPSPDDDTPVFNLSSFPVNKSESGDLAAPKINFLGKDFALINTKIGFSVPFFDKIEINHNAVEKKFEVIIGKTIGGEKDDPYWKDDYKKYKSLIKAFDSSRPSKDIYNEFRKWRKEIKKELPQKGKMLFPFDLMVGGFGELSYASDADKYFEGGILVSTSIADVPLIKDWPIPPAPYVFLNLKFKIDVNGKVGFFIVQKNPVKLGTPNASIEINPSLDLSAAAGAPKIASIGGGGTLDVKGNVNIPFETLKKSLSAKITGKFYLMVSILGFEEKREFPIKTALEIWPSFGVVPMSFELDEKIDMSGFKLIPREKDSSNITLMSIKPDDFIFFNENSFANSSPELINLSNGKYLLVWIGDDKSREYSSDKAALMYAVYANNAWSTPAVLDDDGTGDYNPTILENKDGTVSIVWQDSSKAFNKNDMTLEDALNNVDISYARLNVDTGEVVENTVVSEKNSAVYKMMPLISESNSQMMITWIENSENDPMMFSGKNTIKSVIKSNSLLTWEPEIVKKSDLSTITSMSISSLNDENVIAYVEGNYSDEYDQIINSNEIVVLEGSEEIIIPAISNEEMEKLKEDNISVGVGKVMFSDEKLYWSDNEGIKVIDISQPDKRTIIKTMNSDNFEVFENENGLKAIVSVETEGITNNIYASYENKDSSWTVPIKITDYDKNIRDISGFLGTDGKIYVAFNQNTVTESNDGISIGGTDLVVAALLPEADVLVYEEASVVKSTVIPGESIDVSVILSNMGIEESKPLKATIYAGGKELAVVNNFTALKDGDGKYESYSFNKLKGGETIEASIPFTVPDSLVSQKLDIVISSQDGSSIGVTNKKASVTINATADLSVKDISFSKKDEMAKIIAVIKNNGYVDAHNIVIKLFNEKSRSEGKILNEQRFDLLKKGEEYTVEFTVDDSLLVSSNEFDYKRFIVEADFDGEEWIFDNNTADILINPERTQKVYLVEDLLSTKVGETTAINYSFENENAANKTINWLSSDTRIATVDTYGNVKALKNGKATITAVPYDGGESDSLLVTVGEDTIGVSSVEINENLSEMKVGDSAELTATVKPENATNKNVKWYSTNEEIISIEQIDNKCILHAVGIGDAQINVVTDDGAYSASSQITVSKKTSSGGGVSDDESYTVTFESNGGSKISYKRVVENNSLREPEAPVKEGYIFKGWFTDKELTKEYNFANRVTKNITLYAKWESDVDSQIVLTIGEKEAIVFGKTKTNDVAPKIVNDRTMLPIRFIAEALGADVEWDGEERVVTIVKDDIEIIITIDSAEAIVNGKKVTLDSPAFIENDRTYLPLRFVSENLGAKVEWIEKTQQVIITK